MPLGPGVRVGPYEIVSAIGTGGMGEVYRARDTRLKRDIALKFLPVSFASDPDRLARFQREAEVLASLNHPNIATIHGLEEARTEGGPAEAGPFVRALIMELVEGETLADRIARGPIPVDEALPIAKQVAEALEAAHEQGIIHRDLKPANIKVRPDGAVKVLDFGLGKLNDPNAQNVPNVPNDPNRFSLSPTITSPALMTGVGVLLGTAAYMSPEQAKGRAADKRSDIWAFGCVLYEMLTGRRAFPGDDVAEALAAVIKSEPDWQTLPDDTPASIRRLLRRCTEKDRRERLHDIGDAQLELKDVLSGVANARQHIAPSRAGRRERVALMLALIAAVAASAGGMFVWRSRGSVARTEAIKFSVLPPTNTTFGGMPGGGTGVAPQIALSPDGRHVAFVAASKGAFTLWVRSLGSLDARELAGTNQAAFPFWSPDGRFIGFFAEGKLKKVSLNGGPPLVLCDSAGGRGGTWNTQDVIVFAPGASALQRFFSSRQNGAIFQAAVNGGGREEVLFSGSGSPYPTDWSRDGQHLAFTQANRGATGNDVMILPFAGDRKPFAFTNAPFTQYGAVFAPDRRWIAYSSVDATSGVQIFVQPFPSTGGQYQVSRDGGTQPMWRGDGKELFFLTPDGEMMAVAVDAGSQFATGNPETLFRTGVLPGAGGFRQYAVTRDGQRFLINAPLGNTQTSSIVVTNWRSATTE